jgi:glycosyltransferase involved in cell wall biosynthesis
MLHGNILFFSTTTGWAACEELWSQASIDLAKQGFSVSASVSAPLHPRVKILKDAGVYIKLRPQRYALWERAWHYAFVRVETKLVLEFQKALRGTRPELVIFSEGLTYPPVELLELCISQDLPFVTISHKNCDDFWPSDVYAARYRKALSHARRCYFVSEANLRLAEKQIGTELPNAEVVRNPYNTDFNSIVAWPDVEAQTQLRLACVARLDPGQKGQDILLEALAGPAWVNRDWHLSLYGDGPVRNSLERLVSRLKLSNRVTFAGYVNSVAQIWSSNHVLTMPSRHEGLPLAMVEAMLCGRPVLATDVAGHSEIIVDGETGFLVGPPTVAAVAQGLERLWMSRNDLETMGKAGAKRIRELVPADPIRVFSEKIRDLTSWRAAA